MIAPRAPLPLKKTEIFESIFDYFDHKTFTICYRHSARDAPIDIAKVDLSGIRMAKKGITKVKATLGVEKDLVGRFGVEDCGWWLASEEGGCSEAFMQVGSNSSGLFLPQYSSIEPPRSQMQ
jgi:hypothetical protein